MNINTQDDAIINYNEQDDAIMNNNKQDDAIINIMKRIMQVLIIIHYYKLHDTNIYSI